MISIHILPQKRDVFDAAFDQFAGFVQNAGGRAADLGAPRIGHHAKSAELVAAFLHRQERGRAAQRAPLWQKVELVLGGKFGIDQLTPRAGHLGQAVIGLRSDHQIDQRHPSQNLGALGLGHAARHANLQRGLGIFQRAQTPQIRIQLFTGLFADVAGVQKHHIRLFGSVGQHIAIRDHGLGHPLAVIDIHLTAIGFDEQLLCLRHGDPLAALPISQSAWACNDHVPTTGPGVILGIVAAQIRHPPQKTCLAPPSRGLLCTAG